MSMLTLWALFGALTSIIVSYTRKLTPSVVFVAFLGGPLLFGLGVIEAIYLACTKGDKDGD